MNNSTVKPTRVSTVREEIVLETAPARAVVVPIRGDLDWLMRDVSSTPYAVIARGDA
jgi:hypothetical protein